METFIYIKKLLDIIKKEKIVLNMEEKKDLSRDLPISLQAIEKILIFLNKTKKELLSIRNISEGTGLSMRVVKNVLLQLERFNQVERIVEINNILPKWRITKFGARVVKEAKNIEEKIEFPSRNDELIYGFVIPKDLEKLKNENKVKQEHLTKELNTIQLDLSKFLGPVLNLNNPNFEDLLSFLIKRIKYLKQKVSSFPADPIASYLLKRKGEKQKSLSKQEEKFLMVELFFFNSIILNQLKRISEFDSRLTSFIESNAISNAYSLTTDLRDEIRILTDLINQRESISADFRVLSSEHLKELLKNNVKPDILENILEKPIKEDIINQNLENIVIKFHDMLNKGEKHLNDHFVEISKSIPLFSLYNLIRDEFPNLIFTVDQLEQTINNLANNGYIPGIKIIQEDEDHYLKLVQLEAHDVSKDDQFVINLAMRLQKFTLADVLKETNWPSEKALGILNVLAEEGVLKYKKSFLHGDEWYIIVEQTD